MKRLFATIEFLLFYIKEVVLSNFRVAHDVLTPTLHAHPRLVEIPLSPEMTDVQLTVLANLITMTPGTLSIDVSEDRSNLLIHAMYSTDIEALRRDIKENYERRVLNVF